MPIERLKTCRLTVGMISLILISYQASHTFAQAIPDFNQFQAIKTAPKVWWQAVHDGDLQKLKTLNQDGPYIRSRTEKGFTALITALNQGHTTIVDWLLENGADANDQTDFGYTTLMAGCVKNNADFIKRAIKAGVPLDARLPNHEGGNSAMHFAAINRATDCLDVLIANGADVKITNRINLTPLGWALYNGRFEIFQHLVDKGLRPEDHDLVPGWLMYFAIKHNRPDLVLTFGKLGMAINRSDKETAMDVAFDIYHLDCARALLQITRWSENTQTDQQEKRIIDTILEADTVKLKVLAPTISQTCRTDFIKHALKFAQHRGQLDQVRIITDANFETFIAYEHNRVLENRMRNAIKQGKWSQVNDCLFAGVDINTPEFNREIYMLLGSHIRKVQFVNWLIEYGYKIQKTNTLHHDPVSRGVSAQAHAFVKAILKLGVPVGRTALPIAVKKSDVEMIQILLSDLHRVDFDNLYENTHQIDIIEYARQYSTPDIQKIITQAVSTAKQLLENGGDK